MEHQGQFDFDPEKFDFCIHRKKRNQAQRVKQEVTPDVPKKIKTLLPKTKALTMLENTLLTTVTSPIDISPTVSTPTTSSADGGKISLIYYLLNHVTFLMIYFLHSTNSEMVYCKYLKWLCTTT